MITHKSREEIARMRRAGRVVAEMHRECVRVARPGVTTLEVDAAARAVLDRRDATSNFLGYGHPPFSGVICASPNEVIVHGIPGAAVLVEGDILSIDCGAIVDGWHADAALTIPIGEIDAASARLLEVTERSLAAAITQLVAGNRLGDVGAAVEKVAVEAGFSVVREYVGHGIGTAMHEEPQIPNYGGGLNARYKLGNGLVVAVEPMVNAGEPATRTLADGWTVVTADGSRSAHFEHTVALTEHGPEVLTLP